MRYRSRRSVTAIPHLTGNTLDPSSGPNVHLDTCSLDCTPRYYDYERLDFRYTEKEDMVDAHFVQIGPRLYNAVTHNKQSAATLAENQAKLVWSPPSPATVYTGMSGFVCMTPPSYQVAIPWTDLVVGLAEKVENTLDAQFLGSVFIKELGETVSMIRNPFSVFSTKLRCAIPRE